METPSARSVVVGVDRSEAAARAADWAAEEAARRGCELHIVHFLGTPHRLAPRRQEAGDELTAAQEFLERLAHRVQQDRPGPAVTWEAVADDPVSGLVELSRRVALEAVGARGLNRFAALLLGSVSGRLIAHAACPVVVVRSGAEEPADSEPAIVLGAAPAEPPGPVWFAFAEAARWEAPLRVVRAWLSPQVYPGYVAVTPEEAARREAEERAELAVVLAGARKAYPRVRVIEEIALAEPEEALVQASRGAYLVVVGARRKRPAPAMPLGAVPHRVVQHAHCPVAVVPV